MNAPKIATAAEWLHARKALLDKEKELTRCHDELAELRRELPWVRVDKNYVFEGPSGPKALSQLFGERSPGHRSSNVEARATTFCLSCSASAVPATHFDQRTHPDDDARWAPWRAYHKALVESGVYAGGSPLARPDTTATTIRVRGGERHVQDGPFADTKEQLGGFIIVDVPGLDAALHWASGRADVLRPNTAP